MAIVYSDAVKEDRLDVVIAAIDGGTGAGYLEICSAGYADVLATIPFAEPCGTAAAGVLTFDTSPEIEDASADATGTAAIARIKNGDDTVIASGLTVGTTGSDINLTSVAIVATETVTITSATITHG